MAVLGVQMFTLRKYTQKEEDLGRALARVREIGFTAIQVSAFGPDVAPEATAKLCKKHDLVIGGTHVGWPRCREDLDRVIEEHKLWDCNHLAIGMLPPQEYLTLEGLNRFIGEMVPVAEKLAEAGLTFSYHNHHFEFVRFDGHAWLDHLLAKTSPDHLKMELDTHWVVAGGGNPVDYIEKCGERMPLLHLKDFVPGPDFKRRFAAIGDGNLNWAAILNAAGKYAIDYYLIEQDDCYGEDEFDCLARSYNYLNNYGLA